MTSKMKLTISAWILQEPFIRSIANGYNKQNINYSFAPEENKPYKELKIVKDVYEVPSTNDMTK